MAILSNINDLFRVDSAGAVYFGTSAGTNGQILKSVGTGGSPVWIDQTDITGPFVLKAGDTMTGSLVINGSNSLTVGGALSGSTATFTGLVSGITPTAAANFATKAYVDAQPQGDITEITLGNGLTGTSLSGPIPNVLMSGSYTGKFTIDSTGDVEYLALNTTSTTNKRVRLQFTQNDNAGMEIGTDYSVDNSSNFYFYDRVAGSTMLFTSVASSFFPGSLRIGMTASSSQKLHVQGSNHFVTFENTSATANTYTQMLLKAGTAHSYIWTANQNSTNWGGPNSLNIYTQEAGAIAFFTTSIKRMTIAATGNVGVGTGSTAPSNRLTVNQGGGVRVTGIASGSYIELSGNLPGYAVDQYPVIKSGGTIHFANNGKYSAFIEGSDTYFGMLNSSTQTKVQLHTNGNTYFLGGSIGIGTTTPIVTAWGSTDTRQLTIVGSNYGVITLQGSATALTKYSMGVGNNRFYMAYDNVAGRHNIVVNSSGYVGIGTTTPDALLDLESATPALRITDTDTNAPYELKVDGGTFSIKEVSNSRTLMSMTTGAVITLDSLGSNTVLNTSGSVVVPNGSVGIGTTSPTTKLSITDGASMYADSNYLVQIKRNATNGNDDTSKASILLGNNSNAMQIAYGGSTDRLRIIDGGAQERFTLLNGGNVGIGVTGPSEKLEISGKVKINSPNAPNAFAELNIGWTGGGETRAIDIDGNWQGGESKSISFTHGSAATNMVGQINCQHNGPGSRIRWGRLYHSGDSSTYTMELISSSQTTANLTVAGNITAAADVVAYSDERLKSNIKTLDGSKVLKMRGVSFEKEGKKGSGVIAQELEKVAPELVNNDNEYKGVAYGNLVGYLIEAIKELEARVKELENK